MPASQRPWSRWRLALSRSPRIPFCSLRFVLFEFRCLDCKYTTHRCCDACSLICHRGHDLEEIDDPEGDSLAFCCQHTACSSFSGYCDCGMDRQCVSIGTRKQFVLFLAHWVLILIRQLCERGSEEKTCK